MKRKRIELAGPTTIAMSFSTLPSVLWKEVQGLAGKSLLGRRGQRRNGALGGGLRRSVAGYAIPSEKGALFACGSERKLELYSQAKPDARFRKALGLAGTYGRVSTAKASPRIAFVYSSLQRPDEVYLRGQRGPVAGCASHNDLQQASLRA